MSPWSPAISQHVPIGRTKPWTAAELRALPQSQRDAILAAAAAAADDDYRNDLALAAFDAFGDDEVQTEDVI
jgi:hypothetical protein